MGTDLFSDALAFVLKWEGGYTVSPGDPGGATNMGITQFTYDSWRRSRGLPKQSVAHLTREEAAEIYRTRYWDAVGCSTMPPALALMAFDCAVNQGVGRAKELLKVSRKDWRIMAALRLEHYASLRIWSTFGRGWARRLADCVRHCARLDPQGVIAARRLFLDGQPAGEINEAFLVNDKLYVRRSGT